MKAPCAVCRKIALLMVAMLSSLVVIRGVVGNQGGSAPVSAPEWQSPPPGLRLSVGATHGADGPVLAMAPDGSELMVVYNLRVTSADDRDPYYTVFDGHAWSAPAPVLSSNGADSAQLALTYDTENAAHLIWEESGVGLVHMRYQNSTWHALNLVTPTTIRLFGTAISSWGAQKIDVVWAAKPSQAQNPNIYHSRSSDGGDTWSASAPVATSAPTSQFPQIAHDASGNVHVAWQESTSTPGFEIRYARGLPWNQAVVITPPSIASARRPALVSAGNTVYLALTYSQALDVESTEQWAYFTRCSQNCTSPVNWIEPLNASGQPVRVNASAPFDLIPEIARHNGCTFIFFHGYIEAVTPNEVIWDVNSCAAWSGGGRDQVTGFDMRGINPQVVMNRNTVHLVFEWVDGIDHQVYYMEGLLPEGFGPGDVYLPLAAGP